MEKLEKVIIGPHSFISNTRAFLPVEIHAVANSRDNSQLCNASY